MRGAGGVAKKKRSRDQILSAVADEVQADGDWR